MDRVQADHFAGQEEAEHLLVAGMVDDIGLDRAAAHRGDGVEWIAFAEDGIALMERTDVLDQHMQLLQRGFVVALRHAGLRKRAGTAEMRFIAVIGANRGQTPGIQLHAEHALIRANGLVSGRCRAVSLEACIGFDYTQIDGRLMMAASQKKATQCVAMKCNRLLPREGDTCFTDQDREGDIGAH